MGMTMQYDINIFRRNVRRDVDESKSQTVAFEIDCQRPIFIPIAISTNDGQRRPNRFQAQSDRWLTNIAQMPNLVGLTGKLDNDWR